MEILSWSKVYSVLEKEILKVKNEIDEPLKIKTGIIQGVLPFILERQTLIKYLDFDGVCFDDMNVCRIDFSGAKNVSLDPQTVMYKSLYGTKLHGDFTGKSFDGVDIRYADFTGAKNVDLNSQTVKDKSLRSTKLNGDFTGKSFDGVDVEYADFSGTKNADLDPQTVKDKSLSGTKLNGDFTSKSFDGVDIGNTDFTNATNIDDELVGEISYIKTYFRNYAGKKQNRN